MRDFKALWSEYACNLNDDQVKEDVSTLLVEKANENKTVEVYKLCFNCIDLTSLGTTDGPATIEAMVKKVNVFPAKYPDVPSVAAICVYPVLANVVKDKLQLPLGIAAVSAGFPTSQTFLEVKVAETAMAVSDGASEIDVVISVGKFLEEDFEMVYEELAEIKSACHGAHLKVILETGALVSAENIKKASVIAMVAGADFIKTSTGKMSPAATVEAAYVMCTAIKEFYQKTGEKVGFKPAGGIVTTEDAVNYYTIVKEILGEEWLNNKLFRIGASRLANSLLTDISGQTVAYF
ncbi:MAG: deoxyribose-phosphate aldolase [Bacteroidetes bacterium]|nr:deoxyribose-phosphate aldolase [Bacteroidota bacterium]